MIASKSSARHREEHSCISELASKLNSLPSRAESIINIYIYIYYTRLIYIYNIYNTRYNIAVIDATAASSRSRDGPRADGERREGCPPWPRPKKSTQISLEFTTWRHDENSSGRMKHHVGQFGSSTSSIFSPLACPLHEQKRAHAGRTLLSALYQSRSICA